MDFMIVSLIFFERPEGRLRHLSTFFPIDQNSVLREVSQPDLLINSAYGEFAYGVQG
jgi:hypothetical protein